jgi:hypothetical protein
MACALAQPQQPSLTMMMLLLQPSPLVSLVVSARDASVISADDVGCKADAYRSAAMLLLLQAGISHSCPPPLNRHRRLALITTLRRMWLLEHALGAQALPPPAAFTSGPEREFEFLAGRLGLSCEALGASDSGSIMIGLADAVFKAAARTSALDVSKRFCWPLGLPLQPSLHMPPDCFSDLLVACTTACSCDVAKRAASMCL